VGASCISGAAVLIRPTKNPRPAPAASQRPAPVPRLDPSARLTHNETSTEVYAIHPSGLPLARDSWMVQGSFGFPPELRTPPLPATHAEGGARPSNTCLRLRTRHQAGPPICESTRYVRPRVAAFLSVDAARRGAALRLIGKPFDVDVLIEAVKDAVEARFGPASSRSYSS
jgi:hypothetical protein